MTTTGSLFVVVVPVAKDRVTHFARRDSRLGIEAGPSLCGELGPPDRFSRPRWQRTKTAQKVCNACHASACKLGARVEW